MSYMEVKRIWRERKLKKSYLKIANGKLKQYQKR